MTYCFSASTKISWLQLAKMYSVISSEALLDGHTVTIYTANFSDEIKLFSVLLLQQVLQIVI